MRIGNGFLVLAVVFLISACGGEPSTSANKPSGTKEQLACISGVESGRNSSLTARECASACAEGDDKRSCGALALANLQVIADELGVFLRFLRPAQSPSEFWAASGLVDLTQSAFSHAQASSELEPMGTINLRQFDFILAPIVKALRGIRTGAYHFVEGTGEAEIGVKQVPLHTGVVTFLYGDVDSFALKGDWTARDVAALGAVANFALTVIDLVYSQKLVLKIPGGSLADIPALVANADSLADILALAVKVLNDSPNLFTLDDQAALKLAHQEFHAAMSLMTGRSEDLEGVASANVGLLGMISHGYEVTDEKKLAERFTVLRDVDGDGRLSRGDAVKWTFLVNEQVVEIALPYPLSAKLTVSVFDFLAEITGNLNGNGAPALVAAPINAALQEFSVFGSALGLNYFPDALGLDFKTFFEEFNGFRSLLPYWYRDPAVGDQLVNEFYFDASTSTTWFVAYELEPGGVDHDPFQWVGNPNVDWLEFEGKEPEGFNKDGLEGGHYVLMQTPDFAGLLQVNTGPFINQTYGMSTELSTQNKFERPDNRKFNGVLNAMLRWGGL